MEKIAFQDIKIGDIITTEDNMEFKVIFKSEPGDRWVVRGIDKNKQEWTLPLNNILK